MTDPAPPRHLHGLVAAAAALGASLDHMPADRPAWTRPTPKTKAQKARRQQRKTADASRRRNRKG